MEKRNGERERETTLWGRDRERRGEKKFLRGIERKKERERALRYGTGRKRTWPPLPGPLST